MFNSRVATEGARGNGQDPGLTQRTPATAFVCVDSFDRQQPAQPSGQLITQPINNFVIQKRQTFMSGFFHRIGLTEVRFPFPIPNLNPRNNIIDVSSNGITYPVTVPEGFYTPTELATELETVLAIAIPAATWTVAWSEETMTFNITSNANFTIAPHDFGLPLQTRKGLYYMLNYTSSSLAPSLSHASLMMPNMQYTTYVDICSRALTQFQQSKDSSSRENQSPGLICRLYLNNFTNEGLGDGDTSAKLAWPGCRGQIVHRDFPAPKMSAWQPGQFVDQIDITLYDDCGNLLYYLDPVNTNNDFQLTFLLSEN